MALQSLIHQTVEERPTVVTEGGTGVTVGPELVNPGVRTAAVLVEREEEEILIVRYKYKTQRPNGPCLWVVVFWSQI